MSLNKSALDSLRIERDAEPERSTRGGMLKWLGVVVLALVLAIGAYVLLGEAA